MGVLLIRAVDLLGSPIITKYVVPKLLRLFSVFYCDKFRKEIRRRNKLAGKNVNTKFLPPPADRGEDEHDVASSLEGEDAVCVAYHTSSLEEEGNATSDVKMEEINGKERKCANGLIHSSAIDKVATFAAFPVLPEADVVLSDFQEFFDDITSVVRTVHSPQQEDGADDYSSTDAWVHW